MSIFELPKTSSSLRTDAIGRQPFVGVHNLSGRPRTRLSQHELRLLLRTEASDASAASFADVQQPDESSRANDVGDAAAGFSDASSVKAKGGLKRFWYRYNELLDEQPVFIKSMTSLVGFALGDILAQLIGGNNGYNALRTLRLTLFGVVMDGPVGHWWYTTLDKNVMPEKPKSNRAVVLKTALDQLVWAPLFTCVFFTFMCCLEGRPNYIMYSIQKKLIPVLLANYVIWPAAHIINFKFIPSSQRILYINVCQVLWSSYLSACQARA